MGAWGPGTFQNDDALDWVDEFHRVRDKLELIEVTLATILSASARGLYLELPECSHALAAAEVVAALNGRPSGDLRGDLKEWAVSQGQRPAEKLLEISRQAIWAITADSELKELWEEGGGEFAEPWYAAVNDLAYRLAEKAP